MYLNSLLFLREDTQQIKNLIHIKLYISDMVKTVKIQNEEAAEEAGEVLGYTPPKNNKPGYYTVEVPDDFEFQ